MSDNDHNESKHETKMNFSPEMLRLEAERGSAHGTIGRLPGSDCHGVVCKPDQASIISHTYTCLLGTELGIRLVTYFSGPHTILRNYYHDEFTLRGSAPSHFLPPHGHLTLPTGMRRLESMLQPDRWYLGWDFPMPLGAGLINMIRELNTETMQLAEKVFEDPLWSQYNGG